MSDLGRRAALFASTKAGKQLVVKLVLTAGVLLNLAGIFLDNSPHADVNLLHALTGAGLGLVLVAVVLMFVNRKAPE